MEFKILDDTFSPIEIVENYKSIIWTLRFNECGDFELYAHADTRILSYARIGYYLFCSEFYDKVNDRAPLMIIESLEIETSNDEGNYVKITGRDLKSIFDRRIIWGVRSFDKETRIVEVIQALIDENIINPQSWEVTYNIGGTSTKTISINGSTRAIPNFVDETSVTIDAMLSEDRQYNGDNIYDTVVSLCNEFYLGWDVIYDFRNSRFIFTIKDMVNKSYDQTQNIPIMFSTSLDNLKSSKYIESSTTEKNSGLINGEGDEYNVMYNLIGNDYTGLNRREIAINASDISQSNSSTGDVYSNATYLNMLYSEGEKVLSENTYIQDFEGTVQDSLGYEYKKDYDVGDICEILNEYGIQSLVYISEVILSNSGNEISIIPTFSTIE